jgi:hypothetical protein
MTKNLMQWAKPKVATHLFDMGFCLEVCRSSTGEAVVKAYHSMGGGNNSNSFITDTMG